MDGKLCDECTGSCKHNGMTGDCCPECEESAVIIKAPDHETFERMNRGDEKAAREVYDFACLVDPDFPNKVRFKEFISVIELRQAE